MGSVWESDLPNNEKLVALAYADHADHYGRNVYPSIGLIAAKCGYSRRNVRSITRILEEKGVLIRDGKSPIEDGDRKDRRTNRYLFDVGALTRAQYFIERERERGEEFSARARERGEESDSNGGNPSSAKPSIEPSYTTAHTRAGETDPAEKEGDDSLPLFPAGDIQEAKELWEREYELFLEKWQEYFPEKTQPRPSTHKAKFRSRWNHKPFRTQWKVALKSCADSPHLKQSGWFQVEYFLRNNEKWRMAMDGAFDGFDQKIIEQKRQNELGDIANQYRPPLPAL
jgi:hypothetical protein